MVIFLDGKKHGLGFTRVLPTGPPLPTFFCLNGLLQPVAPAPALHGPPRELVHHHNLLLAHQVLTVPDVELFGSQGIHNLGAGRYFCGIFFGYKIQII